MGAGQRARRRRRVAARPLADHGLAAGLPPRLDLEDAGAGLQDGDDERRRGRSASRVPVGRCKADEAPAKEQGELRAAELARLKAKGSSSRRQRETAVAVSRIAAAAPTPSASPATSPTAMPRRFSYPQVDANPRGDHAPPPPRQQTSPSCARATSTSMRGWPFMDRRRRESSRQVWRRAPGSDCRRQVRRNALPWVASRAAREGGCLDARRCRPSVRPDDRAPARTVRKNGDGAGWPAAERRTARSPADTVRKNRAPPGRGPGKALTGGDRS